jgi:AcrR family transcriptional regulator
MTGTVPAPPWRTPRKTATSRQPLSAEAVLSTALRIVDREGLDGLSMRRVAQELGTGAASLYVYVTNKEELLEQLLDRVIGDIPLPAVDPERWVEQLKQLHCDSRAALLAHGDLAKAAQANLPIGPNSLRLTEVILALMRAGGVPDRYAAWSLDQLGLLVVADAVEASIHQALGRASEAEAAAYFKQLRDYLAALPADTFPNLREMATTITEGNGDERFEFGIGLMIDGLAAHAERAQR